MPFFLQCVNIIKLSGNSQLSESEICLQSGMCKKEAEPHRKPCPICDAIESNIKQPMRQYSRKTADVKRLVSDICRKSTTPSLKAQVCIQFSGCVAVFHRLRPLKNTALSANSP